MGTALRPGEYFAGYQIVRKLGSGGMGAVYQARDRDLPRFVALKLLTVSDEGDPEHRIRFRREADAVARLEHPNIVTVYARGEDDHQLWISMTFVDGVDVASALRYGAMHPARTVRIIGETAAALDHAHETGILHRDVKPANILLTQGRTERALLTDFGIAKTSDESRQLTRKGEVLASVQYSAPERLMETGDVDHRADVYSLGCTLFHMLTGRLPYPGDNMAKIVYAHAYAPVPRPSDHIGALPRGFDEVIARALAKQPEQRFESCAHFAWAAAQTLREFTPAGARPPTPPRPIPMVSETAVRPPETMAMPRATMAMPTGTVRSGTMPSGTLPPRTLPPRTMPSGTLPSRTMPSGPVPPTAVPPEFDGPSDHSGSDHSGNRKVWIALALIGLVLALTMFLGTPADNESAVGPTTTTAPSTTGPLDTTTTAPEPTTTATQTSESPQTSASPVTTVQPVVTAEVPDVRGTLFAKAKEQLEKLGFIVVAVDRRDDSAKGTVVALDPASGTTHRVGTTITVYVSTGASTITMPDLSGLTVAQAEAALKQLGWKGTAQQSGTAVTDSTQAGTVVGQTPASGSSLGLDAAVTLHVGKLATSTATSTSTTTPAPRPTGG